MLKIIIEKSILIISYLILIFILNKLFKSRENKNKNYIKK